MGANKRTGEAMRYVAIKNGKCVGLYTQAYAALKAHSLLEPEDDMFRAKEVRLVRGDLVVTGPHDEVSIQRVYTEDE